MNVYIGGAKDYSAMQGPCASGFHIPLQSEWQTVNTIGQTLGAWTSSGYTDVATYLKLPLNGFRDLFTTGQVGYRGTNGLYWSSDANNDGTVRTFELSSSGAGIYDSSFSYAGHGGNIRAFSNTVVVPDSNWTVLYQGTGDAGIYHNSTLGLISLSSDGTNWITIADKNLGATTVWNSGNTLSAANCGYYYQRGNNNGFAWSGSLTTSTTLVNASSYGPGNYYSSSTFIKPSSSPYSWDSSNNKNLRGGETGIVSPAELKNAYIGEYVPPYLCFTANTASSTVKLNKTGSPTAVTLETSTDGNTWSTYTIGNTITLSNIGDKVYWRNTSETDTGFSTSDSNYYNFVMSGSIAGSGDITSLLNKNGTTTVSSYCFFWLFYNCYSLTVAPSLPATTLSDFCYYSMFYKCTSLSSLPKLPATTLKTYCYSNMFNGCTNIKLSTTQTGTYQTPYRIPITGTGTTASNALYRMFYQTGGAYTSDPSINTTYYTSNTVV